MPISSHGLFLSPVLCNHQPAFSSSIALSFLDVSGRQDHTVCGHVLGFFARHAILKLTVAVLLCVFLLLTNIPLCT